MESSIKVRSSRTTCVISSNAAGKSLFGAMTKKGGKFCADSDDCMDVDETDEAEEEVENDADLESRGKMLQEYGLFNTHQDEKNFYFYCEKSACLPTRCKPYKKSMPSQMVYSADCKSNLHSQNHVT
jgi:hypothetical protein